MLGNLPRPPRLIPRTPESLSDCEPLSLSLLPLERLSHLPCIARELLPSPPLVGGDELYSLRLKPCNGKPPEFLCRSCDVSSNLLLNEIAKNEQ